MRRTAAEIARALRASFTGATAGAYVPAIENDSAWRRHAAATAALAVCAAIVEFFSRSGDSWRASLLTVVALMLAWTLSGRASRRALAERFRIEPRRFLLCVELAAAIALGRALLESALVHALRVDPDPARWITQIVAVLLFLWALGRIGADHSLRVSAALCVPPAPRPANPTNNE
jgi:hypothetical protein